MSAFDPDTDFSHDVGFRLLRDTPVTLFHQLSALARTTSWLTEHGYEIAHIDASAWASTVDLHRDVALALNFPDYYGHNLDALNDCLRDVVTQDYGWNRDATGLVVAITGYEGFTSKSPVDAHALLDLLAAHSRSAALLGRRLICVVQTDDPNAAFEPVGASPVLWDDSEGKEKGPAS